MTYTFSHIDNFIKPYKYKYNGKEFQDELGLNTYAYGWRDYDPATARFNKIDRFAEKYNPISPYSYGANSPLRYIDVKGDSLFIANNTHTQEYLNNSVKSDNVQYINYNDDGSVSLNFGDLSQKKIDKILSKDDGLAAINNLSNAVDSKGNSENYYFEVSNNREGAVNGESFKITLDFKSGERITDNSWVSAFSTTPRGDGFTDVSPANGYNGAVYISPGTVYQNDPFSPGQETSMPMGKVIRHELNEMYLRGNKKMPYTQAHESSERVNWTSFVAE